MTTQINWHNLITTVAALLGGVLLIILGHSTEGIGLLMGGLGVASPGMPISPSRDLSLKAPLPQLPPVEAAKGP